METERPHGAVANPFDLPPPTGVRLADASAVIAAVVATGLPLLGGLTTGWEAWRVGLYLTLATLYLAFIVLSGGAGAFHRWLCAHPVISFGAVGLICMGLVATSGDALIQPVVFTVPFVAALVVMGAGRAAWLGAAYMALLGVGLWLNGERDIAGLLYPVGVYSALLVFMAGFVGLAQEQAAARERADALSAELAAERDTMAALAAENARLAAENALTATLAERNRIARELHDTIAQGITAVAMQLEAAERAFGRDPERARQRVARANELARATLAEVRRSVWTLAAPMVEGPALGAALVTLAERFGERTGVVAHYDHAGPPLTLDSERATQLLRIAQEALQNVERHAAACHVELGTRHEVDGTVALWVHDDGRGFDPTTPPAPSDGGGFGLLSLRERARLAGGALAIESAPGDGTTITLTLPAE
jgi:signal transduction histidine kinase